MSGKTALVVDDSKSARFALRKYLEQHAYQVDTAESAEAAYRLLRDLSPDLIFLDHIMPGEDGFEALRQIKADPRTGAIPVVICSGVEGEAFVADARSKGAAGVLAKPPTPEQLRQVLDAVTREPEAVAVETVAAPVPDAAPVPAEAAAAPNEPQPGPQPADAELEARLQRIEQQLLPRLEQLEQELAALRRSSQEQVEQAARQAADRIATALLKALGREA